MHGVYEEAHGSCAGGTTHGYTAARRSHGRGAQDFREELTQPKCQAEVHRLTARASQDVRMDEPLADACFEDRSRLCDGVQPVRAHRMLGRLTCQPQGLGCSRTGAAGECSAGSTHASRSPCAMQQQGSTGTAQLKLALSATGWRAARRAARA